MKKRIASAVMALLLCLTLLPAAALAEETEGTAHQDHPICGDANCTDSNHVIPNGTNWTSVDSLDKITTSGNYYLTENVTLSDTWTLENNVVLCLNGHSIKADGDFDAINVHQGSTFTLCDCTGKGKVTHVEGKTGCGVNVNGTFDLYGGTISGNTASNGGGVAVYNGGTFTMSGGTISDNMASFYGGGVFVNGGTFTMNGGEISGNTATEGGGVLVVGKESKFTMSSGKISGNTATDGIGYGGVYVADGTFEMDGGSITGNTATYDGGGVCADGGTSFKMEDGSISSNTAKNGGGVGVLNGGKFEMKNGTISGNTAKGADERGGYGGGVYVPRGVIFTMSNGSITNNTAQNGGGVGVLNGGTFTVSGAAQVTGNKNSSNADNNVYLAYDTDSKKSATITIGGALTADASIGVTTANEPTAEANIPIATGSNLTAEDAKKFKSDQVGFKVQLGDEKKLALVEHKHIWAYHRKGATITATCTDEGNCEFNNDGGSVTIKPPASTTYDGEEKPATVEKSDKWQSVPVENIPITYQKYTNSGYTDMHGVPTEIGRYKASITVKGVTASVEGVTASVEYAINDSSSSPSYPVTTPGKTENGTVTVSPRSAEKGDTVTITVTPDKGYTLETLTVTDKNGKEVKLTDKGNGKYTFTMPAGKVEINAAFVKEVEVSPFSDVATTAYYYEAVKWAQEKGITGGIGNGLFGPNQPCTRAQIVTFLWRAAGSPVVNYAMNMTDVPMDAYYAEAVRWALSEGITTGTGDGKFSPDTTCTRAQSVTFLFRAIGKLVDSKAEFNDVLTDSYYANAVAWAVENGVTNGIGDGLFGPNNSCTRAQIVTFLYRAYQGQ